MYSAPTLGKQYIVTKQNEERKCIAIKATKVGSVKDLNVKPSDNSLVEDTKACSFKMSSDMLNDSRHVMPKLKERLNRNGY